jgi:hypothetical protein
MHPFLFGDRGTLVPRLLTRQGRPVPDPYCTVRTRRGESIAVRAERDAADAAGVTGEADPFLPAEGKVPDPEEPISARGGEATALGVGAERESVGRTGMPLEGESFPTGGRVPDMRGPILTAPGKIAAIAVKGRSLDSCGRQRVVGKFLACRRIPDLGGPIRAHRDKALAVWRKRHGRYRTAGTVESVKPRARRRVADKDGVFLAHGGEEAPARVICQ